MAKNSFFISLIIIGTAILIAGIAAFLGNTAKWVGHTDLEVTFLVVDAETNVPVPNALIHIRAEKGGFCEDCKGREFTLEADQLGNATQLCRSCMSYGSRSILEDTFFTHLPPWWIQARAPGYTESEPSYLDVQENARAATRGTPFATITIPVRLLKAPQ